MSKEAREVIIDGVRYVPAREFNRDLREILCRAIASVFWGGLGDDWEKNFDEGMEGTTVCISEEPDEHRPTAHDWVDEAIAMASELSAKPQDG